MRRLLSLLALTAISLFLVACSSEESMDGEYYWISENRNEIILTINGDTGTLDSEGGRDVTVDSENQTFEIKGFSESTVPYEYEDGVLTANLTGAERDYYKKGTDAYKEALKEYGYNE